MCACVCVFGIAAIVNSEVKFVKLYSPELFAKISFNHTTELCLLCKEFFVFSKKRQRFLLAPHIWILHLIICYNIFIVSVVVGIFVFTYPRVAYKRLVQTRRLLFVKAYIHTHTHTHSRIVASKRTISRSLARFMTSSTMSAIIAVERGFPALKNRYVKTISQRQCSRWRRVLRWGWRMTVTVTAHARPTYTQATLMHTCMYVCAFVCANFCMYLIFNFFVFTSWWPVALVFYITSEIIEWIFPGHYIITHSSFEASQFSAHLTICAMNCRCMVVVVCFNCYCFAF